MDIFYTNRNHKMQLWFLYRFAYFLLKLLSQFMHLISGLINDVIYVQPKYTILIQTLDMILNPVAMNIIVCCNGITIKIIGYSTNPCRVCGRIMSQTLLLLRHMLFPYWVLQAFQLYQKCENFSYWISRHGNGFIYNYQVIVLQ